MRSFFLFALSGLVAGLCVVPARTRAAEPQTIHSFERTVSKTIGYKYLLALPAGYEAGKEQRWPLILFLHGAGERGDDVWAVAKHGPPKLLQTGAPEPAAAELAAKFIVVSPQCPKNQWWDTDALLALLDEVMAAHRVDPARVYLTGLSMGGFGAWELGLAHPERFAALAPICGGGQFRTLYLSDSQNRAALRSLPVWAFHGAKDATVPLAESQRMVEALQQRHVEEVRFTVYPDAPHDSWTETYANPELYAWFLRHTRAEPAGKNASAVPR